MMCSGRRLSYEWLVEFLDEYDDVVDVHHADTFTGLLSLIDGATIAPVVLPIVVPETPQPGRRAHVGLVRDVFDDGDGLGDRMWAYLDETYRLPSRFLTPTEEGLSPSSVPVPLRFHAEIQAAREEILTLLAAGGV